MKVGTQSMFFFLTSSSIKKMWETTHEKWQIYSFVFTVSEEDNHESTTHTDVSVPPASSRSLNFQNLKSRKVKHMVDSEQQTVTSFILPLFGCCHIPHDKIHWLHASLSSVRPQQKKVKQTIRGQTMAKGNGKNTNALMEQDGETIDMSH